MIEEVIKILKKSEQDLVFLDSIICPVREFVGQSKEDQKMRSILDDLKKMNIVENYSGYMGSSGGSVFLYVTGLKLTESFFRNECKGRPKQLTIFESI